ncbi:flavodoxin family protein [Calothrix rhizosoleniae]|uniref:flavodoxin family protein n=1 Tax=Calothrix rhizosoleniae TaxID=888997 RepID=UPI000B499EB9|nr:flavodoxin family protein [Calothrix rhizosoleniae]
MDTGKKVVGIVGSYRKNGFIDSAIAQILASAESQGAETKKIYLQDQHIEFCTNCRTCLQEPGTERGKCVLEDDMDQVLQDIEIADSLVIGAPVNFGNVNALTRKLLERCVCYGYWSWDTPQPIMRNTTMRKKAVLVLSSAAPAWMTRWLTGALGALKDLAKMLGAKPIGVLWIGLVNPKEVELSEKVKMQAKRLGQKLATA